MKRRFYIGDIVQKNVNDSTKMNLTDTWGESLIGIRSDCELDFVTLFHRPFNNHMKAAVDYLRRKGVLEFLRHIFLSIKYYPRVK